LPLRFSVEVDALYQRFGYSSTYINPVQASRMRERDNSWQFPALAKYHLPVSHLRPFAGVGVSPRIVKADIVGTGYSD
jgi:hypothetical protein